MPPILLLHGFDSSVLEFRRLLPLLANSTETWAVDLFGFGFTQRSPYLTVNPTHILAHLYAFWQSTINQPVILVGASMGGATAIDFTLNHPQAVQSLVLIDSAGINKGPIAGKFLFPPFDYLATEFLRQPKVRQSISENAYFDKSLASRDAQLCAAWHLQSPLWNRGLIEFTKSGGYGAFGDRLNTIQQPTLILWGKNDKILGTKDAHKLGIESGNLVQVRSRRGKAYFPAQITKAIAPGTVFVPMHWGALWGDNTEANAMTHPQCCPESKQPELKACAVQLSIVNPELLPTSQTQPNQQQLNPTIPV
ncbi:alpha/beta fold hydrolase [Arthrospira sp. PCC 8006]|uniref:alpha/beta fold hydrolase n=1 Tax=Arthrospira sp. PCC 8006 TaxID=1982224 RepID=UPI00396F4190